VRDILGIRDERLAPYLVRRVNAALPLPEEAPEPPARTPSSSLSGVVVSDRVKFTKLPAAYILSELARIGETGAQAPYVPVRSPRRDPPFDSLGPDEVRYFIYWRGRVRSRVTRGGPATEGGVEKLRTDEDYVRLYAREIILAMGGGRPEDLAGELLALWETYRFPPYEVPGIDGYLPAWLFDFVFLYEIEDVLSGLLSRVRYSGGDIAGDLYLCRKFAEKNGVISVIDTEDIRFLTGHETIPRETASAANAVDAYLREHFRMGLFDFFRPPYACRENREAFAGLGGVGVSSYTAEWTAFSRHEPLVEFFETLNGHIEHKIGIKAGVNRKPLEEPWKSMAEGGIVKLPISRQRVRPERLDTLRRESDAVRELLAVPPPPPDRQALQNTEPVFTVRASPGQTAPGRAKARTEGAFALFLASLSETEREALRAIDREREEPGAFARAGFSMPEIIIDGINARFMEMFGDLLITSMDETHEIQAEYREELKEL
jgi:hypothetical protein